MKLKNILKGKVNEAPINPGTKGEPFPSLTTWWEHDPEKIMQTAYWFKRQVPPSDPRIYGQEWEKIKAQLMIKFPPPPDVDLDKTFMKGRMKSRFESKSTKLKDIIKEAFAWERTPGKPLPTMAQVKAKHDIKEATPLSQWSDDKKDIPKTKSFMPGQMWSDDFDYTGMLKYGARASYEGIGGEMDIEELKALYESFTDVNYHTEARDLGNAIDWIEDQGQDANRAQEMIEGFMESFRDACIKTLKGIERK